MMTIKKKPKIDYFSNEFKQICMMMTIKKKPKIDYFGNEFIIILKKFLYKNCKISLFFASKKKSNYLHLYKDLLLFFFKKRNSRLYTHQPTPPLFPFSPSSSTPI